MYQRFLAVADKKQEVLDEDLLALVHDELRPVQQSLKLEYLHSYSGTTAIPTATVRLLVNGKTKEVLQGGWARTGADDSGGDRRRERRNNNLPTMRRLRTAPQSGRRKLAPAEARHD